MTSATELPLDWNEWRVEWRAWLAAHPMEKRPKAIPGKNFLADEILGTFSVNGRTVELSEVTFPDLRRDPQTGLLPHGDRRGIGLTFADNREGAVVWTFPELEEALGL